MRCQPRPVAFLRLVSRVKINAFLTNREAANRLRRLMPELPDVTIYIEALEARILAKLLERVRLASPFLLRTIDPPLAATHGKKVRRLRRIGKRIAIGLEVRSLAGHPPHDRRTPPLARTQC